MMAMFRELELAEVIADNAKAPEPKNSKFANRGRIKRNENMGEEG